MVTPTKERKGIQHFQRHDEAQQKASLTMVSFRPLHIRTVGEVISSSRNRWRALETRKQAFDLQEVHFDSPRS